MLTLTVTQLNRYIKGILEADDMLHDLWVKGEISNYKAHSSGHHYFSLKDNGATIRCVMFRQWAQNLSFRPEQGMGVLLRGYISLYERDGQYQLYVQEIQPDGIGAMHLAMEQLKAELAQQGLFEEGRKKPLPPYPKAVGMVTSPTGAAWHDVKRVMFSRWQGAELLLYPSAVQGTEAPAEIAAAIYKANKETKAEVLIVGRGGGSLEELWAFNTKEVALAIAASQIPVVSAVGHEVDYTIADFVADVRAATPSAAAEMVVPDRRDVEYRLTVLESRLQKTVAENLREAHEALDYLQDNMLGLLELCLQKDEEKLLKTARALELLNPIKILARGYAICRKQDSQKPLTKAKDLKQDDEVITVLAKGSFTCKVIAVEEDI
ncbi:MAG: exodeoxyribonuclease VII large subunit [Clostridia bacterium]|nr:exodeoxyribonuclease VII large subunit [Clostridia bacterium]